MPVRSFAGPLASTARSARSTCLYLATVLATSAACLAANIDSASASAIGFTTPQSLTIRPVEDADSQPNSLASRFEYAQASLSRGIIERLMIHVPSPMETASLPRKQKIVPAAPAIVGTASTYNPNDPNDPDAGNHETASGEIYDSRDWTAAIRTDLREQFGGVRFGKNYRPAFALVQSNDRQAIVRINDVGRLKPGRIIDLNARAMRYFDPTLQLGLIGDVRVTPLAGQTWALGPVVDDRPVAVASRGGE